jgi:ribulose 1,5-bisphosphate synthetase/thiazole synthase
MIVTLEIPPSSRYGCTDRAPIGQYLSRLFMNQGLHILVAGGGIGGLAVAYALGGDGHDVTVLEQASEFGEIGAGIQLGPNVFRMFD